MSTLLLAFSTAGLNNAFAQTSSGARLDYDILRGNQAGSSGSFQVAATTGSDGPYLQLFVNGHQDASIAGSINYIAGQNSNSSAITHCFQVRNGNGSWVRQMQILQSGQVKIGLQVPNAHADYKLAVDGKLVAKSVYVTSPSNWADFVFAPNYRLMPLPELAAYLKQYQHLPAIPSASEVAAGGYSLTDMDANLLQTVEELTLQVIALHKEVEQLKAEAGKPAAR